MVGRVAELQPIFILLVESIPNIIFGGLSRFCSPRRRKVLKALPFFLPRLETSITRFISPPI